MDENENERPLRLLCLDGGGVRGLTSLLILKEIFRALENLSDIDPEEDAGHAPRQHRRRRRRKEPRRLEPWQCFDLIGGTSTGGLIAIMLGRLRMGIDEAIEAYKTLSPLIFKKKWWVSDSKVFKLTGAQLGGGAWFEGENLKAAVQSLLKGRGLDGETRLFEDEEDLLDGLDGVDGDGDRDGCRV